MVVGGNVTIGPDATLQISGAATPLSLGGNWTRAGTFAAGTGTVLFSGTNAQAITASTFDKLTINKLAGTATLAGNVTVNSDLNLASGTLDLAGFSLNRSVPGGTLALGPGTLLKVGATFPANFATRTVEATRTVLYNGPTPQSISGETYGNWF
ncbi:MAG: hypothetical protein ABIV39_00015 [Verrucomicrobiota bacterium]